MKWFHKIVPYMLAGSAIVINHQNADAQMQLDQPYDLPKLAAVQINQPNQLVAKNIAPILLPDFARAPKQQLAARAENTLAMYIDNMLEAQKRLGGLVGKPGYHAEVKRELGPRAPVGKHCLYGQNEQLRRALIANGDTLTIIPTDGNASCITFKSTMRKKYSGPEYAGTIKEGRAFETDSAYNVALDKYLAAHGITAETDDAKRTDAINAFARQNFSLEHVNRGSIMIVPRHPGAKTKFHAIMFLGRGRIENGQFVPDETGRYMYTAHNRERIGDLAETWDLRNVFSADIEQILLTAYTKELKRLESMPREQLIEYLSEGKSVKRDQLRALPRHRLLQLVHDKYFGTQIQTPTSGPLMHAMNSVVMQQGRS